MKKINIEISGKDIEFMFGTKFLGEIVDIFDADIADIHEKMQKNPFKVLPTLMFYSAFIASDRKGVELGFTENEFVDMLDEEGGIFSAKVQLFVKSFTKSIMTKLPPEKQAVNPKGRKKK